MVLEVQVMALVYGELLLEVLQEELEVSMQKLIQDQEDLMVPLLMAGMQVTEVPV